MSISISIRFLTGRAHLHPWQAHHSDGRVDWPPAPWRLLRALVAAAGSGITTLPEAIATPWADTEGDEIPLSRLASLLAVLSNPPAIWIPPTTGGHTRQYFPVHKDGTVKNSGSAVFDTFTSISKDVPVRFGWPTVTLQKQEISDLAKILRRLTYFGRAESWCEATVDALEMNPVGTYQCWCIDDAGLSDEPRAKHTLERKLAALLPLSGVREQVTELLPNLKPRPLKPAQLRTYLGSELDGYSLLRCLLRTSGEDMADGLERPIGTRWVHYAVPRAIYRLPRPSPTKRVGRQEPRVDLIRFTLNTATVNRPVLPQLTDTLLVADKLRAAALAWHNQVARDFPEDQRHPRNLCGREADGSIVQGNDHAFFWPTDEDDDGLIDHLSVFSPSGLEPVEVEALRRLLRIGQRGGRPDLLLTPVFLGRAAGFAPWTEETTRFVSATPYFCPLHLGHGKSGRGVRSVADQILKSLLITGVIKSAAELISAEELFFSDNAPGDNVLSGELRYIGASIKAPDDPQQPGFATGLFVDSGNRFIRALAFCRKRRHHVVNGNGRMFLLEFATPRPSRPFSIGAQAHFGLGLFVPVVR